jgi:hypothetical protein
MCIVSGADSFSDADWELKAGFQFLASICCLESRVSLISDAAGALATASRPNPRQQCQTVMAYVTCRSAGLAFEFDRSDWPLYVSRIIEKTM